MAETAQHIESAKDLDFTPIGKVFPSPVDWRDQVMYQLLIDRFDDGKDCPLVRSRRPQNAAAMRRTASESSRAARSKGITRRLDYLREHGHHRRLDQPAI